MVAFPISQRLRVSRATAGALVAACLAGAFSLFLPADLLERIVSASGLPAVLPAAEPPLGYTARLALAVTLAAGIGGIAWIAAVLTLGDWALRPLGAAPSRVGLRPVGSAPEARPAPRRAAAPAPSLVTRIARLIGIGRHPATFAPDFLTTPDAARNPAPPPVRRADAHPDAPARAPLLATRDLGAPFDEDAAERPVAPAPAPRVEKRPPVEQPLPHDLDTPLAAIDPSAIPDVAATPPPPVQPLAPKLRPAPKLAAGERLEVFELATPIATSGTDATIQALLARLEQGVARRAEALRAAS